MSDRSATLRNVFRARLRVAREAAALSQRALGERIGLDPFTASVRINRYERGVHEPNLLTLARIGATLNLPVACLVAENEPQARLVLAFFCISREEQDKLLAPLPQHSK